MDNAQYKGPVCKGCWALGNNCKTCERCIATKPTSTEPRPTEAFAHHRLERSEPVGWMGIESARDNSDHVGKRFGRLVVVERVKIADKPRTHYRCLCDCGKVTVIQGRALTLKTRAPVRSCGCLQPEAASASSKSRVKHGNAKAGHHSPTYVTWLSMKKRCLNPADPKYPKYGGAGVTIAPEWEKDFEAFLRDMGPRPNTAYTIDRIDPEGNYTPDNCRWANAKTQSRNKRVHRFVEFNGRTMCLSEACELSGTNYRTALSRLNNGKDWMLENAQ